jgi:hypothetical protein
MFRFGGKCLEANAAFLVWIVLRATLQSSVDGQSRRVDHFNWVICSVQLFWLVKNFAEVIGNAQSHGRLDMWPHNVSNV